MIRVAGLVAGYARPVVGPVSFALAPGEVLGLWGANGAGKSTLLGALTGAAAIFAGGVERRAGLRLAYQEQVPVRLPLMPVTGDELLRAAGARPAPDVLAPLLHRRLDRLSGGQFQLLGVWCALGCGADLILLDEPTNNLDPEAEAVLAALLAAPPAGAGVLVVSHERAFLADACSRVLEIDAYRGPS